MMINKNCTYENDFDKMEQVRVRTRVRIMTVNGVGGSLRTNIGLRVGFTITTSISYCWGLH